MVVVLVVVMSHFEGRNFILIASDPGDFLNCFNLSDHCLMSHFEGTILV